MNIALQTLLWVGYAEAAVLVCGLLWALVLWWRGILPVLLRLGNGLAKRKIAIFATGDNLTSLKSLLLGSGLFLAKNIFEVAKLDDIGQAESATVFLVFWHDWEKDLQEILRRKRDKCPLIVYAPVSKGRIPDGQMSALDGVRNTSVTNFRGRLLNDIISSMITTSYEKDRNRR